MDGSDTGTPLRWVDRNPLHPGEAIRLGCLGDDLSVDRAARLLGIPPAELGRVLRCQAPVTLDIARRLAAQGWSNTPFWLRLQDAYDRSRMHLRREHTAAQPAGA